MNKPERILIVDDEEIIREVLTEVLGARGYVTETAATGQEALDKAQETFFHLAIVDLKLPDRSGTELFSALKERHPDLELLVLTGHASLETAIESLNQGVAAYLLKPVRAAELVPRVASILERQRLTWENRELYAAAQRELAERQRLEQELRQHRDHLEELVQTRTAELQATNEQLQREIAERRRAEEALRGLSAQLIHVQETERRRLSRELHDELGQALTGMNINLAMVEQELPPGATSALRERVADLRSLAAQTLDQIHELALNLRPALLDDLGLAPTLRWYLAQCAPKLDLQVEFEALVGEERLPAEVETVLFRAVQEALTNVARHAQTNRVRVRLARRKSRVVLTIEDDGRGFEVEEVMGRATAAHGMGLVGMRERVASLGGRFDLQSRPGQGTRLSIEIPV